MSKRSPLLPSVDIGDVDAVPSFVWLLKGAFLYEIFGTRCISTPPTLVWSSANYKVGVGHAVLRLEK